MVNTLKIGALALAVVANAAETNSTPEALNPFPQNTIPDDGGPTLYYNGTGPVPPYDETSPNPAPITPVAGSTGPSEDALYNLIISYNQSKSLSSCEVCTSSLEALHTAAVTESVATFTNLLIRVCNAIPAIQDNIYAKTCEQEYSGVGDLGPYLAQLLSKMSNSTGDFQALCYFQGYITYDGCDIPPTIEIDESEYFSPKPESASVVPEPCGEVYNVLHLSDWHLDPRYDIGSEGNCSQYLCCRPYSTNTDLDTTVTNASVPASRFGYLYCDSPPDLALSSFNSMPTFFDMNEIHWSIFTGDIVSHDNDDQLSRAYVEYEETVTYEVFKARLGSIPVYPTLGNHDSLPEAFNTQNALNPNSSLTSNAMSWNYELLSSM